MSRVFKVLVTAGSTLVMIDKVRGLTNIFNGRTGALIAKFLHEHGIEVVLLTSNPALAREVGYTGEIVRYRTFDELMARMEKYIHQEAYGKFDAVVHSAAVSDYMVEVVYQILERKFENEGTPEEQEWLRVKKMDRSGKISSENAELLLELGKTAKIVGLIREPWGFTGKLIEFKLLVQQSDMVKLTDRHLVDIASESMFIAGADHIVANFLETHNSYVYLLDNNNKISPGDFRRNMVYSRQLPKEIWKRIVEVGT